jgi:cysteine desulfurase
MRVYLDNAATTPLDPQVLEAMMPYWLEHFGNPSSIHSHGREARAAIERARKTVAALLNTSPAEIFFTSGGTEADNAALRCSVESRQIKHAITSPIEHHAVLHTLEDLEKRGQVAIHYVRLDDKGHIRLDHLEELLQTYPQALVSLMHGNNEIGNITDIEAVGTLCKQYNALFHSDTVQTVGHYPHDLQKLSVHFMVGAAHKFHGPKGVGFLYISNASPVPPFIRGGSQERNMRGGTENVAGIIGLAKALEIACQNLEKDKTYILGLKSRMIEKLKSTLSEVSFNGDSANLEKSLYTVLNVSLPPSEINDMLLFNLDIHRISASGGSACSSGANLGSHVLRSLNVSPDRASVRFSFSKYNTVEEVDYTVETLANIFKEEKAL